MPVIIQDEFSKKIPLVFRWNLPTANQFLKFDLPEFVKKVTVRFETNAGYFSYDTTDEASLTTHYGTIDANTWFELNIAIKGNNNTAKTSIYLAPSSNNTVVQILLEG